MWMFHVRCSGEPVIVDISGNPTQVGFEKNEYVWACNEVQACRLAVSNVMKKLKKINLKEDEGETFVPRIAFVNKSMAYWKVLRNEGFVFYLSE